MQHICKIVLKYPVQTEVAKDWFFLKALIKEEISCFSPCNKAKYKFHTVENIEYKLIKV
jgi:hypothetical protein